MSLLVVSVATKPVTSVTRLFSNSETVFVDADSTSGQLPCAQVTLVLGELLLDGQYAAAEYWEKNWRLERMSEEIAESDC
jgi:hypothetical protein